MEKLKKNKFYVIYGCFLVCLSTYYVVCLNRGHGVTEVIKSNLHNGNTSSSGGSSGSGGGGYRSHFHK